MKIIQDINKNCVLNRILITRIIFLRGLSLIYLIFFISVYNQIQGLWGKDGILPSNLFLSRIKIELKNNYFISYPTLAWFLNLNSNSIENYMYIITIIGILISLLILFKNKYLTNCIGFFILWYILYNINLLGQSFTKFSCDTLLSEIGFITIFFAPFSFDGLKYINYITQINNIAFYLLKFILLKYMLSTGINIIGSKSPFWLSFNGLNYFFEALAVPTPLSYIFHYSLKDKFKKIISAFCYFILLYIPFGYFLVWRRICIYAGQITFIFNLLLALVENYGVLHLLIFLLNSLNFDDMFYRSILNKKILNYFTLDYLSIIIPIYIKEKRERNKLINQEENKLISIKEKIDAEKDENKIIQLKKEYTIIRRKILDLVDDEGYNDSRIEDTLIISSNITKEIYYFVNFLCANLFIVFIYLYPIKNLLNNSLLLHETIKHKLKLPLIILCIYIYLIILIIIIINIGYKLKNALLSEKNIMSSIVTKMIEYNNNDFIEDSDNNGSVNKNFSDSFFKISFQIIKYVLIIVLFTIYFIGSVKFFLLNIDIDLFEEKIRTSKLANEIEKNNYAFIKYIVSISDNLFSNYDIYGIYGNIQSEILSDMGRSELEFEYTIFNHNVSKWYNINYGYRKSPKFLFFYLPRLYFKLFDAAQIENLDDDPWIIAFLSKIFERNKVVLDLLGYEVEEKNILYQYSFFYKIKNFMIGVKKEQMIKEEIDKIRIDIFKYKFNKSSKNSFYIRKRYKEYLAQIEKYGINLILYEKMNFTKPNDNKNIQLNKFQFVPIIDIIIIIILMKKIIF